MNSVNSDTSSVLYNLGLSATPIDKSATKTKSTYSQVKEAVYDGNIGVMEVMRFFMQASKENISLKDYVKRLTESDDLENNKLAWRIIQQYLNVTLKGPGFGN